MLRSTCGNRTRTTSPASKRVIGGVEIVFPFGEGRERLVEGIAGAAKDYPVAVNLVRDVVAGLDSQGKTDGARDGRLRLCGDADNNHVLDVRNFLAYAKIVTKIRADHLLVIRGLAESRTRAQALIM